MFRLLAAGPSGSVKWTHLEHLTKGSEGECGGENVFFKALRAVFTTHLFGRTSFQQGSQLSIGCSHALWTAFHSVLIWSSRRDLRISTVKSSHPLLGP